MPNGLITSTMLALQQHLRETLPSIPDVRIHRGRLTSEAVAGTTIQARALLIAYLGGKPDRTASGQALFGVSYGIFCITDGYDRVEEGLNIMEAVAASLLDFFPGTAGEITRRMVGDIDPIDVKDNTQVCLWGTTWGCMVRIGTEAFADDLTVLSPNDIIPVTDQTGDITDGDHDLG